jgi:hypothetical protein
VSIEESNAQIEMMAERLGKSLYRGVLKTVARVWNPTEIHDPEVLQTSVRRAAVAVLRFDESTAVAKTRMGCATNEVVARRIL